MDEKQALLMITEFPWVPSGILPDRPNEIKPPVTMRKAVELFIKALYATGFEIRRGGGDKE